MKRRWYCCGDGSERVHDSRRIEESAALLGCESALREDALPVVRHIGYNYHGKDIKL